MKPKQVIIAVVAIVVIIVGAVVTYKRMVTPDRPTPTAAVLNKRAYADIKTGKVFTVGDMANAESNAQGYMKNPETGEFTVSDIMTCASCGKETGTPRAPIGLENDPAKCDAWTKAQKCPLCSGGLLEKSANP